MSLGLRSIKPWSGGSPFSSHFRKLFNDTAEAASRFLKIERQLKILIAKPEQVFDEAGGTDVFPILVLNATGEGWPKEYGWAESQIVGTGQAAVQSVLEGGRNSKDEDLGLGLNRLEMVDGFGVDIGPYGQPLTDDPSVIITVLPIAPNSPTHMTLEINDSEITVPVFEAYNPMTVECVTP